MNKPADLWSMREKVIFVFGIIMSLVYLVIGLSLLSIGNFLAEYDKIVKIGNPNDTIPMKYWLMSDINLRFKIAEAGKLRVINDKHDIINRAKQFIDNVKSI